MNKQEKEQEITRLSEALRANPPLFVLEYRGLTVNQVSALRKKVRATASRYKVVKNRLALRAVKGTPFEALSPHFKGPTAIAYSTEDPAALAKALAEFSKDNQGIAVRAGLVDGRVIDAQAVKALATLPSRSVLISQLLAVLNAPMTHLVRVLQGPARNLVMTVDQIARKKASEGAAREATPAT